MAIRKKRPKRSESIVRIPAAVTAPVHAERLIRYIEDERLRLMRVTTLLETMRIAMEEIEFNEEAEPDEPCFSDVIHIARDVVKETISRLDSLALRPMIETLQ